MIHKEQSQKFVNVQYFLILKYSGQRLDNFLIRELKSVPRSRIMRMIRKGEVRVNGKRAPVHTKLQEGDRVRVPPVRLDKESVIQVPSWLYKVVSENILYEDGRMLVLNKPPGVAVHAGGSVQIGVIEAAREVFPHDSLELVHRIDQATSGCLMLSKTRVGLLELHHALQNQQIVKKYDAIVHGEWPAHVNEVSLSLRKYALPTGERRAVVDEKGKSACTLFTIVDHSNRLTWLNAIPQTGRTHQIRVHCQSQGCPIVGDEKYGVNTTNDEKKSRLMLHASSIEFSTGLVVEAPLETTFAKYWSHSLAED